jgi:hypothetical protein
MPPSRRSTGSSVADASSLDREHPVAAHVGDGDVNVEDAVGDQVDQARAGNDASSPPPSPGTSA